MRKAGSYKQFEGKTYSEISEIMTEAGYKKMKHSNVRTTFIHSLAKIADEIVDFYGESKTQEELLDIARNPMFQEAIRDYMHDINNDTRKKENELPIND